eukprot:gene6146-10153_t
MFDGFDCREVDEEEFQKIQKNYIVKEPMSSVNSYPPQSILQKMKKEFVMKKIVFDGFEKNILKNEILILKELKHPNVIELVDFFSKKNDFYICTCCTKLLIAKIME